MSKSRSRKQQPKNWRTIVIAVGVLTFAACFCGLAAISLGQRAMNFFQPATITSQEPAPITWSADSADLTIAVAPVMAPTLAERVEAFNRQSLRTPDGKIMSVQLTLLTPQEIVDQSLGQPRFQAVAPDSSIWLNQIDQRWAQAQATQAGAISPRRVGEPVRYAISPIVIAAWEDTARALGWPENPVGWGEIQRRATQDSNFKWNHPSTQHAAGLLATLAEFYAGAGLTRGLTEEIATQPEVLDYVRSVEATVRFYGEGETVIVERLAEEGRNFLDAFVAQEQTVIQWNSGRRGNPLVAIYPAEGTLWTDHPLALLELGGDGALSVTNNQRLTFRSFVDFLTSEESQRAFLAAGYRPADLSIELDASGSPFANTNAVDWRQPKTTLQIPSAAVVEVIQNVWWYTKRPTNVYLVVDTSGSMEGENLRSAKVALNAFIAQIQGDRDQLGIVEFGSGVKRFEPLRTMSEGGRARMNELVINMQAYGNTALIDAVWQANQDLQTVADREAINAIVVMTDGQENASNYSINDLRRALEANRVPVVIFTIAFGRDADAALMQEMARIGGGQFRRADETDLEELYRIISTYF
ncbi:MAG: substrate-binding domain-containing protein [Caldilineaceae bacterium]|nr:substrate-binding domain-containing protein [Caldilineaceae bacterium]